MDEKNEKKTETEKRERRLAVPFFAVLLALSVIAFVIPLRPTQSELERRTLAEFPALSGESLLSGDFFDGVSLWFSDTFPGRELLLSISSRVEELHGLNYNAVALTQTAAAEPTADLDQLLENLETQEAEPSAEALATPEPTPVPTTDPLAAVESWEGFDAEDEMSMYGDRIVIGGMIFTRMGFSEDATAKHVALMNRCGDILAANGVRFFNLPIPTSVGVMLSSDLVKELNCADQSKLLSYMFAQENDNVYKVNAFPRLVEHNDEYLYYRTDHHWTALGAYYAYEAFCEQAGFTPVPLSEYEEVSMGEFWGSLYYTVQNRYVDLDEMIAYVPPGDINMYIPEYPSYDKVIVDMSSSEPNHKYNCFILGDNPVTTITNNDLPDAPNCVVIKDSFGNPFVIYLTQHYHTVYVLDYRYNYLPISRFAAEHDVQDVILAQSIGVTQTTGAQGLLYPLLQ